MNMKVEGPFENQVSKNVTENVSIPIEIHFGKFFESLKCLKRSIRFSHKAFSFFLQSRLNSTKRVISDGEIGLKLNTFKHIERYKLSEVFCPNSKPLLVYVRHRRLTSIVFFSFHRLFFLEYGYNFRLDKYLSFYLTSTGRHT